jgi:tetratricopeptide (TPR) repeat protein
MPTSTEKNNNTSPTAASAGTDLNGTAAVRAADAVRARLAAVAARRLAADGFATNDAPADAALELIAMANQLRIAAQHGEAMVLAASARDAADRAGRLDLRLRALGVEGMARGKHGDYQEGLEMIRAALAVALEHSMTAVAAELYQRLSVVLYDGADLRSAEQALETALGLCDASPDAAVESACLTCMAYVLRERGEWQRSAEMSRELIANGTAVWVAEGLLGAIHCFEGRYGAARRLLSSCHTAAVRERHYNMTVDSTTALARLAAGGGPVLAVTRSARTSNERIKRELGWAPRFPTAREGVPDAVRQLADA